MTVPEKWVDKITISDKCRHLVNDDDVLRYLRNLPYDCSPLEKTAFESWAMTAVQEATNILRQKVGLTPVRISSDRFLIVSQLPIDESLLHRTENVETSVEGFVSYCYLYAQRQARPQVFLAILAHEMIHLNCYKEAYVSLVAGETEPLMIIRRNGYGINHLSGQRDFFGLNEAITERLARIVLKIIDRRYSLSIVDDLKRIAVAYEEHTSMLQTLVSFVARHSSVPHPVLMRRMTQNNFDGGNDFMVLLESVIGEAGLEMLRTVSGCDSSVIQAVRQFKDLGIL
ncbi:MAG: hypothetical protein V1738_04555 [Patescibacteria group bacterium]